MKKSFIVITGGSGFIGSALIKYFIKLKLKEKIISIDNYSSGSVKNHVKSKLFFILENFQESIKVLKITRNVLIIIFIIHQK